MLNSKIEWLHRPGKASRTYNPINGCTRISPGCINCYAEQMASRFSDAGQFYAGLAARTKSGPRWSGNVRLEEAKITEPLKWRQPATVFPSMSDWFHEDVPDKWLDLLFAVWSQCPQHTLLLLTKRAKRMYEYFSNPDREDAIDEAGQTFGWCHANVHRRWPLPNVELGVSAENQQYADERIPWLLKTPAGLRFVSYEPALGGIDIYQYLGGNRNPIGPAYGGKGLDWVIVGGESGPSARPFEIDWARSIVKQCANAGVSCFVKQLGARPIPVSYQVKDKKGGNPDEWPVDLRVRQFPAC